jgi:hypothetical protein
MVEGQGGRCAICRRKRKLIVDHDHETGTVRALLCNPCNLMIGYAGDRVGLLEKGIEYLEIHSED